MLRVAPPATCNAGVTESFPNAYGTCDVHQDCVNENAPQFSLSEAEHLYNMKAQHGTENGLCQGNVCKYCYAGYGGKNCQFAGGFEVNQCSEEITSGKAVNCAGFCLCKGNYFGGGCKTINTIAASSTTNSATNQGSCNVSTGVCECTATFEGVRCSFPKCTESNCQACEFENDCKALSQCDWSPARGMCSNSGGSNGQITPNKTQSSPSGGNAKILNATSTNITNGTQPSSPGGGRRGKKVRRRLFSVQVQNKDSTQATTTNTVNEVKNSAQSTADNAVYEVCSSLPDHSITFGQYIEYNFTLNNFPYLNKNQKSPFPPEDAALDRFFGRNNIIIGGILIDQSRYKIQECTVHSPAPNLPCTAFSPLPSFFFFSSSFSY